MENQLPDNNQYFYLRVENSPFENSIKVPFKDYNCIKHLMCDYTVKNNIFSKIKQYTNVRDEWCNVITQTIASSDNYTKVCDYLNDREEKGITLQDCIKEKNIYKPLYKYGFDNHLLTQLYNLNFVSAPSIGKGELLLNLFVKNCYNGDKGDICIDNKIYEVKGAGGGLKGQKYYNLGYNVQNYWVSQFKQIKAKHNLDIDIPDDGGTQYNLTQTKPGAFFDIGFDLLRRNIITPEQLNKMFIEGLSKLCIKICNMDLHFVKEYIKGIITYDFFVKHLIKCFVYCYFYIENLNDSGLIFIKPDGYINLIQYNDISTITDKYKFTLPSLSSRVGSQGSVVAIRDCKMY